MDWKSIVGTAFAHAGVLTATIVIEDTLAEDWPLWVWGIISFVCFLLSAFLLVWSHSSNKSAKTQVENPQAMLSEKRRSEIFNNPMFWGIMTMLAMGIFLISNRAATHYWPLPSDNPPAIQHQQRPL